MKAPKASRRDAPVACPVCERRVERRMRGQRYCSQRCRQRANYAEKVARGDFSTRTIALPTRPQKLDKKFKAVQWAKMVSSIHILAPADLLAVEIFQRAWNPAVSSAGVPIEIGRWRARTLVTP